MHRTTIAVAAALVAAAATSGRATDGSIGIYADAAATQTHATLALDQPATLYIVARLDGATAAGTTGVEFRVDGFPADWFAFVTANPAAALALGDPIRPTAGFHRANLVFSGCQDGLGGVLLLYTVLVVPNSGVQALTLGIAAGDPPTNPSFTTPVFLRCDYPDFTPVPAVGGSFVVDVQSPQDLDYSLVPGYEGRRGVQPVAGLPGETFRFRVAYSHVDGVALEPGSPRLELDANGDGDSDDALEGTFVLVPADHDSTTVNGKEYVCDVALGAPPGGGFRYRFAATDANGLAVAGRATAWNESLFVRPDWIDLVLRAEEIAAGPAPVDPAGPRNLVVRFANDSDVPAQDVGVRLEDAWGQLLVERTLPQVAPRGTGMLSFDWAFGSPGLHPITVRLDPGNTIPERDESNGIASHGVFVTPSGNRGDLAIAVQPPLLEVAPLAAFRLGGDVHYVGLPLGNTPPAAGARLQVLPPWETAAEERLGAGGEFNRGFLAPAALGTYTVLLVATDGARTDSATVEIVVASAAGPAHGPDLVPEVGFVPPNPCAGQALSARWSVRNAGDRTAAATTLRLEADGTGIVAEQGVGPLAPGESMALPDVNLDPAAPGARWVTVRVDPADLVPELREDDGARTARVWVPGAGPDLGVDSLRAPTPPCVGTTTQFDVWVSNHGCAAAATTRVALLEDGSERASVSLPPLAAGAGQSVRFDRGFTSPGCHLVEFVVDPDSVPGADADPARDVLPLAACVRFCSLPPSAHLDFAISECDLDASNRRPAPGEPVQFVARVHNVGFTDAVAPVAVRFLLDGLLLGDDVWVGPIASGGTAEARSVAWPADFAVHQLRVLVDPANDHPEDSEFNNVTIGLLPYELAAAAIANCPPDSPSMFSQCSPCTGQPIAIRAVVQNRGLFLPDSVRVDFREVGGTDVLLGTAVATGTSLGGLCSNPLPVEIVHGFATEGVHEVQVVVDADGAWPESNEADNTRSQTLGVLCGDAADLTIAIAWPAGFARSPGDTVQSLPFTVRNLGTAPALDVRVRVRLNDVPLCADLALGDLAAGASRSASCDVPWVVADPPCSQVVEACADPDDRIRESSEANNCATTPGPVGSCDLLPVSFMVLPPNPRLGDAVDLHVLVYDLTLHGATATVTLFTLDPLFSIIGSAPVEVPAAAGAGVAIVHWIVNPLPENVLVAVGGACPPDGNPSNDYGYFPFEGGGGGTPVVLSDLVATSMEDGVRLGWRALPIVEGFLVERRASAGDDWQRLTPDPLRVAPSAGAADYEYLDRTATPGAGSEYRILGHSPGGRVEVLGTIAVVHSRGRTTAWLEPARPHPFRPGGALRVSLPLAHAASLCIFDAAGRRVACPWDGPMPAGRTEVRWDAADASGHALPSGVYFARLAAGGAVKVQRLVLLR